ncbi:MAG TPA: alpha/beta hydrolase domain-containing protein [Acidimicrobiia bacterium]|nr:alpha/beta hydrolase domain-containing protein [Acidimicrobiia bacterium]
MTSGGRVVGITIAGRETVDPRGWERTWGVAAGLAGPGDGVVGLDGEQPWTADFELIGPAGDAGRVAVLVDVENRGGRSTHGMIGPELAAGRLAYARVQWQTGHAARVPEHAQGVGLVILREFGGWLRERYRVLVLAGASQSAWCVNTFVGEGFNEDPGTGTGVYDGAFAYLSGGNWLAVNRWGDDGAPQAPYARPTGVPVPAAELLTRPGSDPFLVEISSYTDYYRLRASRSADAPLPARCRHYDFPSPHAPGSIVATDAVFGRLGCNGGREVPMNPIGFFTLGPAPPTSAHFNGLPGVELRVPVVDGDGMAVGGVRFPAAELPLGRPEPVALSPCGTRSIDDVCGNFGGWQPFSADELRARYGTPDEYASRYAQAYDALAANGFALASDGERAVADARRGFAAVVSAPR